MTEEIAISPEDTTGSGPLRPTEVEALQAVGFLVPADPAETEQEEQEYERELLSGRYGESTKLRWRSLQSQQRRRSWAGKATWIRVLARRLMQLAGQKTDAAQK